MNIQAVKKVLPRGAKIQIDTKRKEGVIIAPIGRVWAFHGLHKLYYCQPTNDLPTLYEDIFNDITQGLKVRANQKAA